MSNFDSLRMNDLVIFATGKAQGRKPNAFPDCLYPLNTNTLDKLLIATRHVHRVLASLSSADTAATVAPSLSISHQRHRE